MPVGLQRNYPRADHAPDSARPGDPTETRTLQMAHYVSDSILILSRGESRSGSETIAQACGCEALALLPTSPHGRNVARTGQAPQTDRAPDRYQRYKTGGGKRAPNVFLCLLGVARLRMGLSHRSRCGLQGRREA